MNFKSLAHSVFLTANLWFKAEIERIFSEYYPPVSSPTTPAVDPTTPVAAATTPVVDPTAPVAAA